MLRINKLIVENLLANELLETNVANIVVILYNSSKAVVTKGLGMKAIVTVILRSTAKLLVLTYFNACIARFETL